MKTDGSFQGVAHSGYGGVFRDSNGAFQGAFSSHVSAQSALEVELLAVMEAIHIALDRHWTHLWLETDSTLVIHYYNFPLLILWRFRVHWLNCLHLIKQFSFCISHIYREGNKVADRLADYGATHIGSFLWDSIPDFAAETYASDLASSVYLRSS